MGAVVSGGSVVTSEDEGESVVTSEDTGGSVLSPQAPRSTAEPQSSSAASSRQSIRVAFHISEPPHCYSLTHSNAWHTVTLNHNYVESSMKYVEIGRVRNNRRPRAAVSLYV